MGRLIRIHGGFFVLAALVVLLAELLQRAGIA